MYSTAIEKNKLTFVSQLFMAEDGGRFEYAHEQHIF